MSIMKITRIFIPTTHDRLKVIEENGFEKIHEKQVSLVIRKHRKYQYVVTKTILRGDVWDELAHFIKAQSVLQMYRC